MDSSSKKQARNRFARSRISALLALALAAGMLVSAPSFMSTQPAEAANPTGGIRDKSGAVEKADQKASDLPGGSCVVASSEPEGSQAGFTWNTAEPSGSSPDKKAWGLSLAFDNSKDRTFADWFFTNTGNLGAVLNVGPVPSMEVGQTLPGYEKEPVTEKADESIDITGSRRQRNLNLYAQLTDEKVRQYAEATADSPVRYAWHGQYTKDNVNGLKATQGPNAMFSATVNPWPSENIECNPITVSWESFEKHVIVPGEKTKVGKINIPAVKKDGTDDSMARMMVEAYDGNGKFIGTSDTAASGGEQMLRIDETTGEIYFTWPKYRGTDLKDDKNVHFAVLAKPRTVDQLKSAVEHNNSGAGQAFDSSNLLTRYKTPNVIDSKSFSLDDTEYHNPQYDKVEATITSGVVKANEGPLATEPQKVTFTQTPDLITELEKKKGDGGFEAKAELDQKYVYEGWTVEMDENYNVTVTAPEHPNPGTFARPKVKIEYSNGSTDEIELLVVVDPNHTQITDLVHPELTKGRLNVDLTSQIGLKPILKGYKAVNPAKYEVDPASVPEGWTVTVDATGKVTAKANGTVVVPGSTITPKLKATYPDQTTDKIQVQFQAIADIKIPTYETVTGQPEANMTLKPKIPEQGLSGNKSDQAPDRYTFEDGSNQQTFKSKSGKTWTVRVDEKTGEIITTIPKDAPEGDILDVPVLGHYKDGNFKPQKVKGTVVVLKGDLKAKYNVQVTGPGDSVEHQVTGAPKGSKFSFGNKDGKPILTQTTEDGWHYTIDPNTGVVTSTPPTNASKPDAMPAKPGDQNTISVKVDAPGGLTTMTPVTTVVKLTNNWESNPVIPPKTVYPGDTVSSPLAIDKPEGINVAKEKPFEIAPLPDPNNPNEFEATGENNKFGNPTYKVKTDNGDWIVGLDNDGNVISTAPKTADPGDKIKVPVTVTYEDGSKDVTSAVINVADIPTRDLPFGVEYKFDPNISAGKYKVDTKGVPGKEKMTKDGKWERAIDPETGKTLDPVNEVVLVGTKQPEASKNVTWTAELAFAVETRPNPELKPGEIKVAQKGVSGVKTYTANFTAKGSEASVMPEEKVTQKPVNEIIEYGPATENTTDVVTKVNKPIPYKTKIVFDDTLETGKKVVQDGVFGSETVTSTQKIVNGKPEGDPTVTNERTQEPSDQIIRVGTKCVCEKPKNPGNGSTDKPCKPGKAGQPGIGSNGSKYPGDSSSPSEASNPGSSLAATGAQQGLAALLGAGMIGVGLSLVYARRKTRRD